VKFVWYFNVPAIIYLSQSCWRKCLFWMFWLPNAPPHRVVVFFDLQQFPLIYSRTKWHKASIFRYFNNVNFCLKSFNYFNDIINRTNIRDFFSLLISKVLFFLKLSYNLQIECDSGTNGSHLPKHSIAKINKNAQAKTDGLPSKLISSNLHLANPTNHQSFTFRAW